GLAERADHRRHLPDTLPVGTTDGDRRRPLAGNLDIGRDREMNVVAVAELQHQILALNRGAIADAVDLEIYGVALADAVHHVVDERARRAPGHTGTLRLVLRLNRDLALGDRRVDIAAQRHRQGAELALRRQDAARDIDSDVLRDWDGEFSDSRHGSGLKTRG